MEAGARDASTSPTTTSSAPPSRGTRERVQEFWQTLNDAGDIYEGELRGPVLRGLRGVQAPGRAARRRRRVRRAASSARSTAARSRCCQREELLLPALGVRRPAARALRGATRASSSRESRPQRGRRRSSGRACRTCRSRGRRSTGASRSRGTTSHVLYVWIDALLNYVTAVGYGDRPGERFARTWPADVHLVGKDILRFHAVIWPAMLMAAGLAAAAQVFAHGWLLVGGEKMSKSKLTGIAPEQIIDALRLRRVPLLLPARDRVRSGRLVLLGGPERALHRPSSPTGSATSPRGVDRDGRAVLRRRAAGAGAHEPALSAGAAGDRASTTAEAAIDRLDLQGAIAAVDGLRRRGQRLRHRAGAVEAGQGRGRRAADLDRDPLHDRRGAARGRRAAQPGDAEGDARRCGSRSAPRPRSARSPTSGCRTPARWGQLPAGATVTKGDALFPRIEEPDAGVSRRRRRPAHARRPGGRTGRERPPAPEPLPVPVVDNHCHLDIADAAGRLARRSRTRSPARPRSACRGSCRSAATCPGARWAVEAAARARRAGGRRRAAPQRGAAARRAPATLDAALAEIDALAARPAGARGRRDRARLLPHRRRTGAPRRRSRSARTSSWPSGSTRRW